jgi:hypothetical protein
MSSPGGTSENLLIQSRSALLDAVEALVEQRDAVIVVGAQAVYLRTSEAPVALAEATKDSDFALDPRGLSDAPLIEEAMTRAGFYPNPNDQPGAWMNPHGIPVDLMVPAALAGAKPKSRGARIPPHDKGATRRTRGLEAAVIDNSLLKIVALDPTDQRAHKVKVAGPTALLVAKLHKIGERIDAPNPERRQDKDAHDIYRILLKIDTPDLAAAFPLLLGDEVSREVTEQALTYLADLFAAGPAAHGSNMAGRAEEGIGEPDTVASSVAVLADELIKAVGRNGA